MADSSAGVSVSYYELLGITKDASLADLKKAYKHKALQLHPDKIGNTPEAIQQFVQMKHAYDVLTDPMKRKIYDDYGDAAIRIYEDPGTINSDAMFNVVVRSNWKVRVAILLAAFLLLAVPSLAIIFVCLEADNTIDWSWKTVFVPLWVMDGYIGLVILLSIFTDRSENLEDNAGRSDHVSSVIRYVCFVSQQVILALRMDDDIDDSYGVVFIPWYIWCFNNLVSAVLNLKITEQGAAPKWNLRAVDNVNTNIASAVFMMFIAMKLDDTIDWNWWAIFSPIWEIGLFSIIIYSQMDRDESERKRFLSLVILVGMMLSPFFIAADRLDSGDYSTFYIFIPVFILFGCIFCCTCCVAFMPVEEHKHGSPENENTSGQDVSYGSFEGCGQQSPREGSPSDSTRPLLHEND